MIKAENISKRYENIEALKSVSLSISEGEFYGLLGPNGAGKTTTINILSSLLEPDNGTVSINGNDLKTKKQACKQILGVVPQEIALYETLNAAENLKFWGGLYGLPSSALAKKIDDTLHLLGLYDRRNDAISTYSGGMKRRINIAAALLHSPKILFMDEPTVGIDPQSRNKIYEVLESIKAEGITIVYTTHYMEEAERMCDRIGIIDSGKLIAQGTLEELKIASKAEDAVEFEVNGINAELEKQLKTDFDNFQIIGRNKLRFVSKQPNKDLQKLIAYFNDKSIEINQIHLDKANLESVFLNLTGRKLRD